MRPVDGCPVNESKPWYTKQRVGVNNLKRIIPIVSTKAMCSAQYTNHSLRATSVTRMFSASVPEKLIAEKSDHHSLKALRSYERINPNLQRAIDNVIANPDQHFVAPQSETETSEESTTEKQLPVDQDSTSVKQSDPDCTSSHTFSGAMNHCTINISYK